MVPPRLERLVEFHQILCNGHQPKTSNKDGERAVVFDGKILENLSILHISAAESALTTILLSVISQIDSQ